MWVFSSPRKAALGEPGGGHPGHPLGITPHPSPRPLPHLRRPPGGNVGRNAPRRLSLPIPTGWMLAISGNQSWWCWQRGWLCCPCQVLRQPGSSTPPASLTAPTVPGSKPHLQGSKPCLCCVRAPAVLRPHTPVILLVGNALGDPS